MTDIRYIEKFENIAGTISYSFPLAQHESQEEQDLRVAFTSGVGADYAHDHHGYGVAPKNVGRINIRALAVESSPTNLAAEFDEARNECYRIGLGYLYRLEADAATRRRCLARVISIPSITINGNSQFGVAPLVFSFAKLSDWMATTATASSQTIDTAIESVTITNGGNIPVYDAVFRLRNNGATRCERPVLFNATTGQYAAFLRPMGAADDELYLDTGARLVQFSTNNGDSYANDYSNFAGDFFRLDPGANTIKVLSGRSLPLPWLSSIWVPNFDLSWSFYDRYI